jgi:glycosyltransferase involved in cell wall biosynthesis
LHFKRSRSVTFTKLLAYRRFVPRFDACLAPGAWSREYFEHYGARTDRIFFVPHVIDADFMEVETQRLWGNRAGLRQRWGLRDDSVVFLFVGKFTETKCPLDFVRAVHEASMTEKSVAGLMVGDGPLRAACEDFARSHQAPASFAGFLNQSNIVQAYASGDVLVLPSLGETWGMVVNEAMACRRPGLISDRVGCGPDLVIPEETGNVFPHGNVPALAAAMVKLARNPAQIARMGENAHNRLRGYSLQAAVNGVLQALAITVGAEESVCAQ